MENDPVFNAGLGSCLTAAGTVEMDASVMDGRLHAGAVGAVRGVRNPIRLAAAIMRDGRHVMLAGPAAEVFARQHGVDTCPPDELITERQRQRWQQRATDTAAGTVGAVAVDAAGHVAAATSTGGLFDKQPGRVGDSGIIGAGTYADDALGAASATGHGEAIMRVVLAKAAVDGLHDGRDPAQAASASLRRLAQRTGGAGGIIVVDPLGRTAHAYNTAHMTVGYRHAGLDRCVVDV